MPAGAWRIGDVRLLPRTSSSPFSICLSICLSIDVLLVVPLCRLSETNVTLAKWYICRHEIKGSCWWEVGCFRMAVFPDRCRVDHGPLRGRNVRRRMHESHGVLQPSTLRGEHAEASADRGSTYRRTTNNVQHNCHIEPWIGLTVFT